jgi:hypothetical protein
MGFCTKCGGEVATEDSFCRKCGAPRKARSAPDPIQTEVVGAVERDARLRLKRAHDKLVATLGAVGGIAVIVFTIVLLVIADRMERPLGELFLAVTAFASVALFVGSLVSADFAESINRTLSKIEDPLTGEPLRMLLVVPLVCSDARAVSLHWTIRLRQSARSRVGDYKYAR